eukprot:m.503599 g.503599  ORF g.503599 m.503599 type:complete len:467 (+) comp21851_c0_seq1:118-1518(+)
MSSSTTENESTPGIENTKDEQVQHDDINKGKSDVESTHPTPNNEDNDDDDDIGDISDDAEEPGDDHISSNNKESSSVISTGSAPAAESSQKASDEDDDIGDISDDEDDNLKEKTAKASYADLGVVSSDDETETDNIDKVRNDPKNRTKDVFDSDDDDVSAAVEPEPEQPEPKHLEDVEAPMNELQMGEDITLTKLPNFLSIEREAFDPDTYTYSKDVTDNLHDELGRTRVKLQVSNTIRWRYAVDDAGKFIRNANGELLKESNANIVRWSDGSETLVLGNQVVGVLRKDIRSENNCLFLVRDDGLNRAVATIDSKITFKPTSTKSDFHKQLTRKAAVMAEKQKKRIVVLAGSSENPDIASANQRKKIEEANRERKTREAKQQRVRERHTDDGHMSRDFLDQDLEDGDNVSHDDSVDSDEESDSSLEQRSKPKIGRRIDDDDDEDDDADKKPSQTVKKRRMIDDDDE